MKKTFRALAAVLVFIIALAGLSAGAEEKVTIRLGGLKGATSMGMVKLLDDAENGLTEYPYAYTMAASADELTPRLLRGEMDIAAVPINLASVLYNRSNGAVRFVAISTLGVIYITEKGGDTVRSLADLKGTTVYATGKGSTPEYALTYLLQQNGLEPGKDLTIEWKSEPTEVVALMATQEHAIAMLPQPFVTVAAGKLDNFRIALDLTKEWDALGNGSRLVTAGVIVRTAFLEEHPEAVHSFLMALAASTEFVNTDPKAGAALIEKAGIIQAAAAEKAIPYCNIVCITGEEMVKAARGCLEVLYNLNPASAGGTLPDDAFFAADA